MGTTVLEYLSTFFNVFGDYGIVRLLIVLFVLAGLWLGLQRAGFDAGTRIATWIAVAAPLLLWMAVVWQLAIADVFARRPGSLPALPFAIFVPLLIALPLLMRSRRLAIALDHVPPAWLVGLQVYRIFGAAFLVQWGLGRLSGEFALPAGWGDVLTGLLAVPVALYLDSGSARSRAVAIAWNLLGIFDLLLAITIGALTQTGILQGSGQPASPISYPLVMIPAFAVPLSLILHGMSLWQLKRMGQRSRSKRELENSSDRTAITHARSV